MEKISLEAVIAFLALVGAGITAYVSIHVRLKALEIEVAQAKKDGEMNRADSQKFDERVTNKFDAIMTRMDEKFEVVNDKMNELIREFTKH